MKLYQIILKKIKHFFSDLVGTETVVLEVRPEKKIYNPLKVFVGRAFSIKDIDNDKLNFICREIRESTVEMFDRINRFTDYHISAHALEGSVDYKLRVAPDRKSYDMPYRMVLFSLMDEITYNKEFEKVANDQVFKIDDDEANIHEKFWRINDVQTSYIASVKLLEDLNNDGKVEEDEVKSLAIEFWDFQRKSSFDGVEEIEYLLIEMNKVSGYFQLWRGKEISPYKVLTY